MDKDGVASATSNSNNIVSDVFKQSLDDFPKLDEWLKDLSKISERFELAALRYSEFLKQKCDRIWYFGTRKSLPLRTFYIPISLRIKHIPRQSLEVNNMKLSQRHAEESFNFTEAESVSEIEIFSKLQRILLLGDPGAGKTTFIHNVILLMLENKLGILKLPVLLDLLNYQMSAMTLAEFVTAQFEGCGLPEPNLLVDWMLSKGQCFIFFDGLDEVGQMQTDDVVSEIHGFINRYSENHFVIGCRERCSNSHFENFARATIKGFSAEQKKYFISNWYGKNAKRTELCYSKINGYEPVAKLAAHPLNLSLLCRVFDEVSDPPPNESELYREVYERVLKKWTMSQNGRVSELYRRLPLQRKQNLIGRVAAASFIGGNYLIQPKVVMELIQEVFQKVNGVETELGEPDFRSILSAIEKEHSVLTSFGETYAFPNPAFHEYFVAKYIVDHLSKINFERLLDNYLTNPKWQKVLQLVVEMMPEADDFLFMVLNKVESLAQKKLAKFIKMIDGSVIKNRMTNTPFSCRILAIFYIVAINVALIRDRDRNIPFDFDKILGNTREHARSLKQITDLARGLDIDRERARSINMVLYALEELVAKIRIDIAKPISKICELVEVFDLCITYILKEVRNVDRAFARALDQRDDRERVRKLASAIDKYRGLSPLLKRLRDLDRDKNKSFDQTIDWSFDLEHNFNLNKIRKIERMFGRIVHISDDLLLDAESLKSLAVYLNANRLLIDCLNMDCYISKQTREIIFNKMLTVKS